MNIKAFTKRARVVMDALSCGDLFIKVRKHSVRDDPEILAYTKFLADEDGNYICYGIVFHSDTVKANDWNTLLLALVHEIAHCIAGVSDDEDDHGPAFSKVCHFLGIPDGTHLDNIS